jgi:cytochrome c oxidase subunit 2
LLTWIILGIVPLTRRTEIFLPSANERIPLRSAQTKLSGHIKRFLFMIAAVALAAAPALAEDWGMGAANRRIPPNSVFGTTSTPAAITTGLAYFALIVVAGIFIAVGGLLAWSIIRFRRRTNDDGTEPPQVYGSNPIEFAWTAIPVLIAFVLILTTARTIFTLQEPAHPPGSLNVRVIGHQWWWEFRYPDFGVVTANEMHVPLSDPAHPTPTFLSLESADVAHSFWVPRLAGKTDVIPNRRNTMWIDPHVAGTYLGQCSEFCGTEHALMLIRVVVEPRAAWERWIAAQRGPSADDRSAARGRAIFESTACVNCHTVAGTDANGRFGPDLTHLMSRETIGAGAALNNPADLKVWVTDPATIKPGVLMPAMNLNHQELDDVVAYLATLK